MRRSVSVLASMLFSLATPEGDGQTTTRISRGLNDADADALSFAASVSSDGRYVAFASYAENLVANDGNGKPDIFLFDRNTDSLTLVSVNPNAVAANGPSDVPMISSNGLRIVFTSDANDIVAGFGSPRAIYVRDLATGTTSVASVDDAGNPQGSCWSPAISGDGNIVVFGSWEDWFVSNDQNHKSDVFVRDLVAGATTRVSVDSNGIEGNRDSYPGSVSIDGQRVVFESFADNLVLNDANGFRDVFLRDRVAGTTSLVSVDGSGTQGNGESMSGDISDDGTAMVFVTNASSLGVTALYGAAAVKSLVDGSLAIVSVDDAGNQGSISGGPPSISADGRFVVFTDADDLVDGDTNGKDDVFIRDRLLGLTFRESIASDWSQGDGTSVNYSGPSTSNISSDGSVVVFYSAATNLDPSDGNGTWDVFVRERCVISASWSNYGAGFPGTHGIPTITSRTNPTLGSDVTVDISNSWGRITVALLFLGFDSTDIPSSFGGHLLVAPFLVAPFVMPASGIALAGTIPPDESLCGVSLYLQAWESDPGAAKGVSFTAGLELILGM